MAKQNNSPSTQTINTNLPVRGPIGNAFAPIDTYRGPPATGTTAQQIAMKALATAAKGVEEGYEKREAHMLVRGQGYAMQNMDELDREAVLSGTIGVTDSPAFQRGLRQNWAKNSALEFVADLNREWTESEDRFSLDPNAFNNWANPRISEFMQGFGDNTDFLAAAMPTVQNGMVGLENSANAQQDVYAREVYADEQQKSIVSIYDQSVLQIEEVAQTNPVLADEMKADLELNIVALAKQQAAELASTGAFSPIQAENRAYTGLLSAASLRGDTELLRYIRDNGDFAMTPERESQLTSAMQNALSVEQDLRQQEVDAAEAEEKAREQATADVVLDAFIQSNGVTSEAMRIIRGADLDTADPVIQQIIEDQEKIAQFVRDTTSPADSGRARNEAYLYVINQDPADQYEALEQMTYAASIGGMMTSTDMAGLMEDVRSMFSSDTHAFGDRDFKNHKDAWKDLVTSYMDNPYGEANADHIAQTTWIDASRAVLGEGLNLDENITNRPAQLEAINERAKQLLATNTELHEYLSPEFLQGLGVNVADPEATEVETNELTTALDPNLQAELEAKAAAEAEAQAAAEAAARAEAAPGNAAELMEQHIAANTMNREYTPAELAMADMQLGRTGNSVPPEENVYEAPEMAAENVGDFDPEEFAITPQIEEMVADALGVDVESLTPEQVKEAVTVQEPPKPEFTAESIEATRSNLEQAHVKIDQELTAPTENREPQTVEKLEEASVALKEVEQIMQTFAETTAKLNAAAATDRHQRANLANIPKSEADDPVEYEVPHLVEDGRIVSNMDVDAVIEQLEAAKQKVLLASAELIQEDTREERKAEALAETAIVIQESNIASQPPTSFVEGFGRIASSFVSRKVREVFNPKVEVEDSGVIPPGLRKDLFEAHMQIQAQIDAAQELANANADYTGEPLVNPDDVEPEYPEYTDLELRQIGALSEARTEEEQYQIRLERVKSATDRGAPWSARRMGLVRMGNGAEVIDDYSNAEDRQERAYDGGATILLDSNAVGPEAGTNGITQPLIVIPDDATPEQREFAQKYVDEVSAWVNATTGRDTVGRVLTTSENGRGRANAFHTEPFALTDAEMTDIMLNDEVAMSQYRAIIKDTLGQIPGVLFTLPHSEGDPGAVGNGTDEVEMARRIMEGLN